MYGKLLLGVAGVLAVASAQKLYFKSNRLLNEELNQYEQDKNKQMKGFGFQEPRKYFTGPRTNHETPPKVSADAVVCPGNKSACPTGNTCCMTPTMAYGCCPLPMAVCCQDKRHCCPYRTRCDLTRQACISGVVAIPWYEKTQAISLDNYNPIDHQVHAESVICPDGEHQCADGQTCCRSREGYSCCPLANAVCCSDEVHCCPSGTTCDLQHSRCLKDTGEFLEWFGKKIANKTPRSRLQVISMAALTSEKVSVRCDDKHVCPTGNTCCRMLDDRWGCCPKPEAVCCSDKVHCCPKGTSCDVSAGTCKSGDKQLDWFVKVPAIEDGGVKCDATHECLSNTTCCKLNTGHWGCCPLPKAVCCSDHVHCCPHGTTCDVSSGKCDQGDKQLDWFVKVPAKEVGSVKCDATHECPSKHTCCRLSSGEWGCCPLPEAVCCSDHEHCCPHGTTCDVSTGKCSKGDTQLDWFVKVLATKIGIVQCDSTHECPTNNTCCKLSSGQWGCCPLPEAVCCSDGVHCCPEGTTCDVSVGKCKDGDKQLDWFVKVPAVEVGNVRCDSTHECPPKNTCCMLSSGQWGCCPLQEAVCCSDHVHCCPHGTTCDVSSGKCNNGDTQLDWFVKVLATKIGIVQCDSTHECPTNNTCCKLSSGQWGCCPLPEAVCCSDGVHCCPEGTTCDVSVGKCKDGDKQLDWFVKVPAMEVGNVRCDSTHECPPKNTCCMLSSGQWGCCPLQEAVCCSDHVHCCPHGTTCDVSSGKCNNGDTQLDWFVKVLATKIGIVQCDSTHECPTNNTCCKLSSGQWGCCPLPEAVCCSDGVHCCPEGTTCDVSVGKCKDGDKQLDWFVKVPAVEVGNVRCDSTHECPPRNTCCMLSSGQWGCCPLQEAVCCSDHVHCCPHGTTCDVSSGKCNNGDTQLDWFVKVLATKIGIVQCDSTHECPTNNTCCKLSSGQWGCCPLPEGHHIYKYTCQVGTILQCNLEPESVSVVGHIPEGLCQPLTKLFKDGRIVEISTEILAEQHPSSKVKFVKGGGIEILCSYKLYRKKGKCAVCCSDGVHCCPEGTTCDVSVGKCKDGDKQLDWFVKVPAVEVGNVRCDSTHECPPRNTCCMLSSGQWGCCPEPEAVCCSDHVHCCPHGTTCDVSSGKCNNGDTQLDWFVKVLATKIGMVRCDATHECPSNSTCCKLNSGQWGCCPLPKAVCCSDGEHCCPGGTTCDVSSGKCNRGDIQLDWFVKLPAKEIGRVRCDATHECPSESTCCKQRSGEWGCCPLPKAVCCSDGEHCCPGGTTCDLSSGKCNRGDIQLDWFVKLPAKETGKVQCDATHECPSENTCCMEKSGDWGCCPLPQAVCCSDGEHCCPGGTTCDVSSGKCNRGDIQLDWFVKLPAKEIGRVRCDATHECPSGNTCCMQKSGEWGCCPLPEAVCCSDGLHCCPHGKMCDVSIGKCSSRDIKTDWLLTKPAIVRLEDVICPDGSECQDGQTCCEMNNGVTSYGCCPLPNAVCCNDGQHCCPQGYKCNLSAGVCMRGYMKLPWIRTRKRNDGNVYIESDKIQKTSNIAQNVEESIKDNDLEIHDLQKEIHVQCPGGEQQCPSQYSCCDNGQGGYNCCPMPHGVCCDDHVHCCPHGYICDEEPGICRIPETNKAASDLIKKLGIKRGILHV